MKPRSRTRSAARLSLVAGGVLLAGVAVTGCGNSDLDDAEPEDRAFAFSGQELTVDSDDSQLELVPGGGKDVKVTRWFAGWTVGGSSKTSWAMDGSTLKLRMHCSGISSNCRSKHRIEVPRGVKVTVKEKNGGVMASGFDKDLKISSDNGEVRVADSTGALDLASSNGAVTATGSTAHQVRARSQNGAIRISLKQVPDRVETTNDNGSTRIELPRAPYKVDAHSDNGGTKVDVPRDDASRHTVSARSDNGEVKVVTAG
ncbi:DUF4097 family beta strand repeat-containing protein [Streptomyces olivoreticuli]